MLKCKDKYKSSLSLCPRTWESNCAAQEVLTRYCSHNNSCTLDDKSKLKIQYKRKKKKYNIWWTLHRSKIWRRIRLDSFRDRETKNWIAAFHCWGSVNGALRCSLQKTKWMETDRSNRSGRYRVEWNLISGSFFHGHPWDPLLKRVTAYGSIVTAKDLREHKTNSSSTLGEPLRADRHIRTSRIRFVREGGQKRESNRLFEQQEELCNYI